MFSEVKNFVLEKLWMPVFQESVPAYNIYNTIFYALLFAAGIIYIVMPVLEKLELDYDKAFFTSLAPWIILGGIIASLEPTGTMTDIIKQPVILVPGLFTGVLAVIQLGQKIKEIKDIAYTKTLFTIGLFLSLTALSFHSIENLQALKISALIASTWLIPGLLFLKAFFPRFLSAELILPVGMHYMDATTTLVALRFGGYEQHLVARYFIEIFGPYGIFILKSLVVIPAVVIVNKKTEGEERLFYLFILTFLGLGIAVRNLLQVI